MGVEKKYVKALVFAVITLNTVVIGLDGAFSVNLAFRNYDRLDTTGGEDEPQDVPSWLETMEGFFFYFYCCELLARILAHEGHFFVGPDWRWNYFDSSIVLMSIIERLVSAVGNSSVFR